MDFDRSQGRGEQQQQCSSGELLSSAKVLAQAAQSSFGNESDKVDKAKVADAAGDLLGAARQYGKLDDKGVGQYVDKAENYLHQYGGGGAPGGGGGHSEHSTTDSKPESHGDDDSSSKPDGHSESGGGGGYGNYLKVAEGFFKK